MKTSIAFLCASITAIVISLAPVVSTNTAQNGTAVIATKHRIKGGDPVTMIVPDDLTRKQAQLLAFAYQVAKEDGHKHPERLQGILLQETRAGEMASYKVAGQELGAKGRDKYFGVAQMKIDAALAVLKRFPEMWAFMQTKEPEEVIANLILNDEFSIRMMSKYLLIVGGDNDRGITAYNRGPGGVTQVSDPSSFGYTVSVKRHSTSRPIRELNRLLGFKIASAD